MTLSDDEKAEKAWKQRNSDGKNAWDDWGHLTQTQAPPSFDLTDIPMPDTQERLPESLDTATGESQTDHTGTAVRHVHVYDESLEDPGEES